MEEIEVEFIDEVKNKYVGPVSSYLEFHLHQLFAYFPES